MDPQSYIALGIVALTLAVFIVRIVRPRKPGGCGHDCDCERKPR